MPHEWNDNVLRLFKVLGENDLCAVGGCVRDALLSLPVKDADFATTHTPDRMTTLLEKAGIRVKPTGVDHGTITALAGGQAFEITTLRKDVEPRGRYSKVEYTKDWHEDAQRRDFTVNALYANARGRIDDPTGQGLADLEKKTLRFIGSAEERIKEDYLRILRLFRFAAQLPGFSIDPDALKAAALLKDNLETLSRERVTSEWLKLLESVQASEALRKASEAGLNTLYPYDEKAADHLQALPRSFLPDSLRPLSLALAFPDGLPPSFLLSNADKRNYKTILELGPSDMSWQEISYRDGHNLARYVSLWRSVVQGPALTEEEWWAIDSYKKPLFPMKAADFQAKGLEGPALGAAFRQAEEEWIARTFAKTGANRNDI